MSEEDRDPVSRRQLFRMWGVNLRRGISEVVSSRLPEDVSEPPLLAYEEADVPRASDKTVADLLRMLNIEGGPAPEE